MFLYLVSIYQFHCRIHQRTQVQLNCFILSNDVINWYWDNLFMCAAPHANIIISFNSTYVWFIADGVGFVYWMLADKSLPDAVIGNTFSQEIYGDCYAYQNKSIFMSRSNFCFISFWISKFFLFINISIAFIYSFLSFLIFILLVSGIYLLYFIYFIFFI